MRKIVAIAVALMLALTSVAMAKFNTGSYSGRTSQKQQISFQVTKTQITNLVYRARYHCSDGNKLIQPSHFPALSVNNRGRFGATGRLSANDVVTIVGHIKGGKARGAFIETYVSAAGNTCRSGKVKFKATG